MPLSLVVAVEMAASRGKLLLKKYANKEGWEYLEEGRAIQNILWESKGAKSLRWAGE